MSFVSESIRHHEALASIKPHTATAGEDSGDDDFNAWVLAAMAEQGEDGSITTPEGEVYYRIDFNPEAKEFLKENIEGDADIEDKETVLALVSKYAGAILMFDSEEAKAKDEDASVYAYYVTLTDLESEWSKIEAGEPEDFADVESDEEESEDGAEDAEEESEEDVDNDGDADLDDVLWEVIEDTNAPKFVDNAGDPEDKEAGYYELFKVNQELLDAVAAYDSEDASYTEALNGSVGFVAWYGIETDGSDATITYYSTEVELADAWKEVLGV